MIPILLLGLALVDSAPDLLAGVNRVMAARFSDMPALPAKPRPSAAR